MDGYDSHHTYEFLSYAERKKIKIYALPPHTLHFLQPLDVGCFQPIKWHHGQALDESARYGGHEFNKTDFLAALPYIRQHTFTRSTIAAGFGRTGIVPFNPKKVLPHLRFLENVNPNQITQEVVYERPLNPQLIGPIGASRPQPTEEELRFINHPEPDIAAFNMRAWEASHGVGRPKTPPYQHVADTDWTTPLTVRTLKRQADDLVQLDINPVIIRSLESTLRGAISQAYAGAEYQRELHRTQAAQAAYNSRKKASRRVVKTGGPIYAETARKMKVARLATDAARTLQVAIEQEAAATKAWRKKYKERVMPNLRRISKAWGKVYNPTEPIRWRISRLIYSDLDARRAAAKRWLRPRTAAEPIFSDSESDEDV